jgi:molybdopterin molybdotransferase
MRSAAQDDDEVKLTVMSFEEARDRILSTVALMESESVEILDSLGRVTAEDVIAPLNLPSFDNSAMDGYAVRVADCNAFEALTITGNIPAGGSTTAELTRGSAIRIMTGAPIPHGCDAVVPLEETEDTGNHVQIHVAPHPGQHIRWAGEDVKLGETVLPAGTLIRVTAISMLASMGRTQVRVYRKPIVAILATGDELVEPGQPLPEGKLFNSNSPALAAAVCEAGAVPLILGVARDDREHLRQRITLGLQADALITAAGVSVGDCDFVRETLAGLGVKQLLGKVNMKPGKAMTFGVKDGKPVFSLPGNPVSAIITFEKMVRPALLKMMGHRQVTTPLVTAILQEELRKKPGKIFFARVRLKIAEGKFLAWSAGHQDTGFLKTMLQADALAVLPAERTSFSAGEEIDVHILSQAPGMLEPCPAEHLAELDSSPRTA